MASGFASSSQAHQGPLTSTSTLRRSGSRSGSLRGDRDVPTTAAEARSAGQGRTPTLRNLNPASPAAPTIPGLNLSSSFSEREPARATDRTDALWAEMQATLEEVELSASGGTRVFGPEHDRKLAELRTAQIALAQAWARSEADDTIETGVGLDEPRVPKAPVVSVDMPADGTGKPDAAGGGTSDSGQPGSGGAAAGQERFGAKLDEETELDILLARKRREANDRYFERVNQGVIDVVAKLEDVAVAMRLVEQESKDVWGEGDNESVHGSVRT